MNEQQSNNGVAHEFIAQGSPLVPWLMGHAEQVQAFSHPMLGEVTYARIGATNLRWSANEITLHWHDDADQATECYEWVVRQAEEMVTKVSQLANLLNGQATEDELSAILNG